MDYGRCSMIKTVSEAALWLKSLKKYSMDRKDSKGILLKM